MEENLHKELLEIVKEYTTTFYIDFDDLPQDTTTVEYIFDLWLIVDICVDFSAPVVEDGINEFFDRMMSENARIWYLNFYRETYDKTTGIFDKIKMKEFTISK